MKILNVLSTPNPVSITFVIDSNLGPPSQVISASDSKNPSSQLARDILAIESVTSLMIQGSWVTVSFVDADKARDMEEQKKVAVYLRSHTQEISLQETNNTSDASENTEEDPILILIKEVIREEVLPYLNSHGGSVEVVDVVANQVFIRYIGACGGCPASTNSTLNGIESILKKCIDPELEVVLVV